MSGRRSGGGGPGDGESRWRAGWGGREPQRREGVGGRWQLRGPLARWTPGDLGQCTGRTREGGSACDDFGGVEEAVAIKTG